MERREQQQKEEEEKKEMERFLQQKKEDRDKEIARFIKEMDPFEKALTVSSMSKFLDTIRDHYGGHILIPYYHVEKDPPYKKEYIKEGQLLQIACDAFNIKYKITDPSHCVKMQVHDGVIIWRKKYQQVCLSICGDLNCSCS